MTLSVPPEGGLYVPREFPSFAPSDVSLEITKIAEKVLRPFLSGDPLQATLPSICEKALDFPIQLTELESGTAVLELFHGPTLAFKDVGARFLAEFLLNQPEQSSDGRLKTVLVATSGDTGAAVASAFHKRPGIRVAVLYPKGRVSPEQERQLTCWGDNVQAFSVLGDFDDCQRIVKEAFSDPETNARFSFISANSINVGRLLPQTVYYAFSSLQYLSVYGRAPGYVIPSGNLGNAVAAFWARKMGFPIREIVLATNANRAIPDFFSSGEFLPRETIATLANAMDVGNPNNMERLLTLHPKHEDLRKFASAVSVDDMKIRETVRATRERWGRDFCPHTATAIYARMKMNRDDWIIVSTAHPAKFRTALGSNVELPEALAALLSRQSRFVEISPRLEALINRLS